MHYKKATVDIFSLPVNQLIHKICYSRLGIGKLIDVDIFM